MQRLVQVLAGRAEAAWLQGGDAPDVLADLSNAYELGLKHADSWIQGELAFWLWRHGRLDAVPPRVARMPGVVSLRESAAWATEPSTSATSSYVKEAAVSASRRSPGRSRASSGVGTTPA